MSQNDHIMTALCIPVEIVKEEMVKVWKLIWESNIVCEIMTVRGYSKIYFHEEAIWQRFHDRVRFRKFYTFLV